MAQLELRPLGVGEIVYDSFTVYRRRFAPMVAVALVLGSIPFLSAWSGAAPSTRAARLPVRLRSAGSGG
ncbi:hypothetical protein [Candidatus Spongiisocius sp.]|uniref:hypothetical protein n=1 Tax=Candidatus Spongiisocius sp. TaxID=3101273 RepID=UPI003B5B663E